MKKILFATVIASALGAAAQTHMQFDLGALNCSPASNRWTRVQPLTPLVGNFLNYTSSASGSFYYSNIAVGDYAVTVMPKGQAGQVAFQVTVTATNLGVVLASEHTSQLGVQTYPTAGKASWTISSADARYTRLPMNNSTASDDYVLSKTGNTTKWVAAGSGSQTPWTANVNASGYSLSNVLNLSATNIYGVTTGSIPGLVVALAQKDNTNSAIAGSRITLDGPDAAVLYNNAGGVDYYDAYDLASYVTPGLTNLSGTNIVSGMIRSDVLSTTNLMSDGSILTWKNGTNKWVPPTGAVGIVAGTYTTVATNGTGTQAIVDVAPLTLPPLPTRIFANVAQMKAASPTSDSFPTTNQVAWLASYYGSNTVGCGWVKWEPGTAAADNGIVFASDDFGRWRRIATGVPTNYVMAEWFGLWPNNGDITVGLLDQSSIVQAAINAAPLSGGVCILPEFGVTIASSLVISNRSNFYFGSLSPQIAPGSRYYPNNAAIINWNGATNVPMLKIHDVGHSTFRNFSLDTRPPTSNAAYWSNYATILIDVDMPAGTTTTTADFFTGLMLRERGTNQSLENVRIAYTAANNCEFMVFEDCQFTGTGANIPSYWISTTNVGGLYGIRVGGGGGGANSFRHVLRNCNFYAFQNFVKCESAGTWNIIDCKGTAAGVAAFDLSGTGPSQVICYRGEGDRQSIRNSTTHQVFLEGNEFAGNYQLSVSNIAAVDAQNLVLINNTWNADASGYTPSVTNSFNSTGWYRGSHNKFASTNDALLPFSKFQSAFSSDGDFGTLADSSYIQKFPLKVPSITQASNVVVASFTDGTASTKGLTWMPGGGTFAIGSLVSGAKFSVNDSASPGSPIVFQDAGQSDRFKLQPGTTTSEMKVTSSGGSYFEAISSNARVDLIGGNAIGTLNFRTGDGQITGNSDLLLLGYEASTKKLNFPNSTSYMKFLVTTNLVLGSNTVPTTPSYYGQVFLWNSNGTLWQVVANLNALTWASTNAFGSGGGSQTPWTSAIDGAGYNLTGVLGIRFGSGGIGTALGSGDLFFYNQGYRVMRSAVDGSGIPSFSFGPDSNSMGTSGGGNVTIGGSANTNNGDFNSVIVGGAGNIVGVGSGQVILGGANNIAAGNYNAVLGGAGNTVSNESFALGQSAKATNRAAVVIAAQDSVTPVTVNSLSNETIYLYAPNGVTINTNNGTTNTLFVFGSGTVSSNWNVGGTVTAQGLNVSGTAIFTGTVLAGNWASAMNPGTFSLYNVRTDTGTAAGTYGEAQVTANGAEGWLGLGWTESDTGSMTNRVLRTVSGFSTNSVTDFVIGTRYTNGTQRTWISASFYLVSAAAGTAAVNLKVEQAFKTNMTAIALGNIAAATATNTLQSIVAPGAFFYFTDGTSGSGASATIVPNSSSRIEL